MKTTGTPVGGPCPSCGEALTHASDLAGPTVPVAGDIGLCIRCAAPHEFVLGADGGLVRRPLTPAAWRALPAAFVAEIRRTQRAIAQSQATRN